jgi:hypothetical protein
MQGFRAADRRALPAQLAAATPRPAAPPPLPEDAIERGLVEGELVDLERVLGAKPSRTAEEEEIVAMVQGTFTEARKMGRDEGRAEGEAAARVRAVLTVLRVRGITVSDTDRERILAEKDPGRLERWHERAILAASVAEVLDENRTA